MSRRARPEKRRTPDLLSELLVPLIHALDAVVKSGVRGAKFQRDPAFIRQLSPLLKSLNLYFDTEYQGWEHVPEDHPCLFVGNHSGGMETNDFWFLLNKWVEERGVDAPLYGLAYNLLFGAPVIEPLLRRLGVVPASQANARRALALGAAVAVFPGGDYEVFRPWSQRNRIDFGGHTGFIKLALSAGVPVVPMTIHGAHQSTVVLTRGRRLAHLAGIDRLHVNVFPFIWNIPLGLTPAFVPSLQLPSHVTVHFDAPLDWSRYGKRAARDPEVLQACYDEITRVMQRTMNRLARQHPHPVLTRLRTLDFGATLRQLEQLMTTPPARRRKRRRRSVPQTAPERRARSA